MFSLVTHALFSGENRENLALDKDNEEEDTLIDHHPQKQSLANVPLCQVKWLWKGKKLIRMS